MQQQKFQKATERKYLTMQMNQLNLITYIAVDESNIFRLVKNKGQCKIRPFVSNRKKTKTVVLPPKQNSYMRISITIILHMFQHSPSRSTRFS